MEVESTQREDTNLNSWFDGGHNGSHFRAPTVAVVGQLTPIQFRTRLSVVDGPLVSVSRRVSDLLGFPILFVLAKRLNRCVQGCPVIGINAAVGLEQLVGGRFLLS